MKIAIYSAFFSTKSIDYIKTVIDYLKSKGHNFILFEKIKKHLGGLADSYNYFKDNKLLDKNVDLCFKHCQHCTLKNNFLKNCILKQLYPNQYPKKIESSKI